ncbi:hypothetical protein [uncultured Pelagimonas sp.]|uniref:hypothetical protein n=1 Tax=uncultured Pelagimonas sp. TaxID=1618102 RepID=UPI002625B503|nr:hypothetical protein [uncultured Pelagimonas sp.]
MRDLAQKTYLLLLRLSGSYTLAFSCLYVAALPRAFDRDASVLIPSILVLGIASAALTLAVPKWTPSSLSHPNSGIHLLQNAFGLAIATIAFALMPMTALIIWDISEPLSKNLSVLLGLIAFGLMGLCWWLALALAIWPRPEDASGAMA